jgi:hypothetical protein
MQQVTGIHVDSMDHVWFLNRAAAADGDEIGGDNPARIDCCVRGPEVIELDQDGYGRPLVGRSRLSPAVADGAADGDRRHQRLSSGCPAPARRTRS